LIAKPRRRLAVDGLQPGRAVARARGQHRASARLQDPSQLAQRRRDVPNVDRTWLAIPRS
jgi:hypothetical protein